MSHGGNSAVPTGLLGENAVLPAGLSLGPPPLRTSPHSTVLQFLPRHPEDEIAPAVALRRVRAVVLSALAVISAGVVAAGALLGRLELVAFALCWLIAEAGILQLRRHLDELGEVTDVLRRHVLYGMTACVIGVLLNAHDNALSALILLSVLGVVQGLVHTMVRRQRVQRAVGITSAPSVLIVADSETVRQTIEDRAGVTSSTIVGACLVDGSDKLTSVAGVPVLGSAEDVISVVKQLNIHEVAVRLESPLDNDWIRRLQWSLEGLGARLTLVTRLSNAQARRVRVKSVGNALVMGVSQARPTGLVRHLKAAAESAVAIVGLVLALPLLMACAVAVKLDSTGPVFFRQERVRDGGRTFTMIKLRTMSVDAERLRAGLDHANEVGGALFKMKADPRITRVGRFLRKSSLDELPQLLNVIRGQMSLVGPRPALPSEVETYDARAHRRLAVKPGLTGLWQVSGRSRLSWQESISLDIDYVDNWSPGRDVRIAMKTIKAVVCKDGAY